MPGLHLEYSNCVLTHLLQVSPRFAAKKRKYSEREQNPNLKGSVRCRPEWYQLYTAVGLLWKVPVELLFEDVGCCAPLSAFFEGTSGATL
jgi:hypothetical protein